MSLSQECHTDVVNHVRFHPSGQLLSGAEDNLVVVLDPLKREDDAMWGAQVSIYSYRHTVYTTVFYRTV